MKLAKLEKERKKAQDWIDSLFCFHEFPPKEVIRSPEHVVWACSRLLILKSSFFFVLAYFCCK